MNVLFILLSSSFWTVFLFFFLLSSLSLNSSLCIHPFIFWTIHRPWLSLKPQAHKQRPIFLFYFLVFLLCSYVSVSFFCAVVTLQFLFIFNLNTFKLCLNWAVINLIMHRHTDDTELHMSACIYTVCVGIHVHTCMSLHRQNIRMQLQKCVWHVRGMIF